MKKLLSLALALVMLLSLSAFAFAAQQNYTATDPIVFYVNKTYSSDETFVPAETLTFRATSNPNNPDQGAAKLTVANLTVNSDPTVTNKIQVTLPSFSKAGKYEFTIEENQGDTLGVTYDLNKIIHVIALVEYDNDNNKLVVHDYSSYILNTGTKDDPIKTDTFENQFHTGDFKVAKHVTGNMADKNDKFDITVKLTLPTDTKILTPILVGGAEAQFTDGVYTKTLSLAEIDGATTFANIPVGTIITISENDHSANGYTYVSGEVTANDNETVIDTNVEGVSVPLYTIINNKDTTIDTGISMDSLPYILILGVVACTAVLFVSKKRV